MGKASSRKKQRRDSGEAAPIKPPKVPTRAYETPQERDARRKEENRRRRVLNARMSRLAASVERVLSRRGGVQ